MATYLILNLIVLAVILSLLKLRGALSWNRATSITLAILLATAALFDSLIIGAGIVQYDPQQILGITVGTAPIEDFFYALIAVILVPNLWNALRKGPSHE